MVRGSGCPILPIGSIVQLNIVSQLDGLANEVVRTFIHQLRQARQLGRGVDGELGLTFIIPRLINRAIPNILPPRPHRAKEQA